MYEFIKLVELYYVSIHGMDIMGLAKSSNVSKANCTKTIDKKVSAAWNGNSEMVVFSR